VKSCLIDELVASAMQISTIVALPEVAHVELPPMGSAAESKYSKFGLLTLQDDSTGFFYRLLDEAQWRTQYSSGELAKRLRDTIGAKPNELAPLLLQDDPLSRGLGMASINAITQHVCTRLKLQFRPPKRYTATQNNASARHNGRVGMIGYFSPLVAQLRQAKVPTTVIELDETLFCHTDQLTVTGDRSALRACSTIYCSASTLLNHSLETLLSEIQHDPWIELIGPTCGCFPDAFFKRGVNRLGSSRVIDSAAVRAKISALEPWGDSVEKYEIDASDYTDFERIKQQLRDLEESPLPPGNVPR